MLETRLPTPKPQEPATASDPLAFLRGTATPAVIHRRGVVAAANRAAQRLFGFRDEASMRGFDFLGQLSEQAKTAFVERERADFALRKSEQQTSPEQSHVSARDGSLLSVSVASSPVQHDAEDSMLSIFGNHTPGLALDYALRYSREVAVLVTDVNGRVVWCNPASTAMTGYQPEELIGKSPGEVLQCERTDPNEVARVGRHIRAASSVAAELLNRHKSGREYWVRVEILPSHTPDGELLGYVGLKTDITAQVTRRQNRERDRDEAVATFSHDARTPLNGLLNLLDLLLDAPLSPPHARLLRHAIEASETLKDMAAQVLDTSRIEHLGAQRPPRPTQVQDLLKQVETLAQGYRRNQEVALRTVCTQHIPTVLVRSDLLQRVLLNLLSNALKYTPVGSVVVRVEQDAHSSNSQYQVLRFSIADTGVGIPGDEQGRIFGRFQTIRGQTSGSVESTGLGLNLCERMLSEMGSALRLYSAPGVGTTVSFELVCRTADDLVQPAEPREASRLDDLRVMVIDDNPVNVLVSTLQLERCGAQVSGFEDVLLALETLFNGDPEQFHVVLMDLQMPKLDGVDAMRRIRRQPSLDMLPVIGLSGEIDPSAIDGALAVGMADFVQKPFNTAELAAKLAVFKPRR